MKTYSFSGGLIIYVLFAIPRNAWRIVDGRSVLVNTGQILVDRKGRESELQELQKAEESHREMLLKDKEERDKLRMDLHAFRRCCCRPR